MSCEVEQAAVEAAFEEMRRAQEACVGLEPNSSEWSDCMIDLTVAEAAFESARERLRHCLTATRGLIAEGYVTFLRVHELKSGFGGGQSNFLDTEVVFRLDTAPQKAFGFQLRNDKNLPARQGMLSLLREAMAHDFRVRVDYLEFVTTPNQNSTAIRIAVLKPRPVTSPTGLGDIAVGT